MISLAGRDILHGWGKFVLTGVGLGLLIGVTLSMAGVYRGMVDDAQALLDNSGADLWVVQKDTLGPYAEPSSLNEDTERPIQAMRGVAQAAGVTYLTMQIASRDKDVRVMVVGAEVAQPGEPGQPPHLIAGRQIVQGHYEAVADVKTGFAIGDQVKVRRNTYTDRRPDQPHGVVGRRPDAVPVAQGCAGSPVPEGQRRHRPPAGAHGVHPQLNPPGNPAVAEAVNAAQGRAAPTSMRCW
ncbi:MAG: ABC transporter permease [Sphingobium sp.]|jgi:putative ABC transport system permease protein|nr:ABC transporter permease [Sphingobium sp.]